MPMHEREAAHTFKKMALFDGLPQSTRERYEHACSWRRYKREEQIIDRLSDTHDVFFVVEGSVRIVNFSLSGREVAFGDLHAGEFFGELAAVDGKPRSASAVATSSTLLAIMPPDIFRSMMAEHPPIALAIMRRLAKIVRVATGRIMDLSTLGAYDRVCAELLRMARPSLKPDGTARIKPIPNHSDIASRVSTARETVARVLADLSRQNLVTRESDALFVRNFAGLEQSLPELGESLE